MQPNPDPSRRRVHDAQFKAKVLAQCREPGVSVASVALANGLNANLVRKWQVGRGLKKSGLSVDASPADATRRATVSGATPPMQFVPVELAAAGGGAATPAPEAASSIQVELRAGGASLAVRWPASQASGCAAWLGELAGAVLKR
jgi:transposase